nr:NAD(P)H-binding protein [Anaerolineae bacterium]
MILITGATGFIGRHLVQQLAQHKNGSVRVLLRSESQLEYLPRGTAVNTMLGNLESAETLFPALEGIHTVFHLIGTDTRGRHAALDEVDLKGTRSLLQAANDAHVGRIIYVSRVGADSGSAYPALRAKGEIESLIRNSGLAYTIFRSTVLFGRGDRFSEHIAMLARAFPFYFVPGEGEQVVQPLWVEDLVNCLVLSLQELDLIDRVITVGGPEILSYRRIVMRVMYAAKSKRPIVNAPVLAHKATAWFLDGLFARWPITEHWLDILMANQTAELGTIERLFSFRPAALDIGLIDRYMVNRRYVVDLLDYILGAGW